MKIRKKLLLSLMIPSINKDFSTAYKITLSAVLIVGILLINFSLAKTKKNFVRKISNDGEQIEKIISSDLDYIRYQMYYTAGLIKMSGSNDYQILKVLRSFNTGINSQTDVAVAWNTFSWINRYNKLTVDGTAGIIRQPIDLTNRDYLAQTTKNGEKLVFGKTVIGALSQRSIVPAGMGIFSDYGTYLGTLVFGLDIDRILTKINRVIDKEPIGVVILRDGEIAFTSDNFGNEKLLQIQPLVDKIIKGEILPNGLALSQNLFTKGDAFIYYQKIRNYPLDLILVYDSEQSYNRIFNLFLKESAIIFAIILLLVVLFKRLYQRIVQPVSQLAEFAKKISERDFSYSINAPRNKELRHLHSTLLLVKDSFEREEILLNKLEIANKKISVENFNKSEFLAAISHDVRNPLSAIISFAHLIQDDSSASKEEIKEWGKDIENCATEILQFINDLMDVNQIASGEFSVDMSHKIDVAEIIRRSIRINRDFARRRQIELISHISNDLPLINLDPRRIKQILVNLISNSIKYSKENTKVEIIAQKIYQNNATKLQIIVKDRGFGMTEEQVEMAMQKYVCIENENSKKVDSFGLGLPLVKQLVEAQHGQMNVESVVGAGTMIALTFLL